MYTEDDKKIKVKNKNSNNDYNDFYTAFSNPEKKDTKKSKKEPKREEPKDEEDYSDFYDTSENFQEPKRRDGVKTILKIGVIILLVVILAVLIIIIYNRKKANDANEIVLNKSSFTLKVGEKDHISYKIVDTSVSINPTFTTSNPNIATVDENGEITAIADGEVTISIRYTVNGKTKSKKCTVTVGDGKEVKPTIVPTSVPTSPPTTIPTLAPTATSTTVSELTLDVNASTTNWTNKDVTVSVDAKSNMEIISLKYAIDCNGDCEYSDVKDKSIVISKSGVTKVTVVAKDKSNKEIKKEVTVKIDKEAPTVKSSNNKNIIASSSVNVCVTCSDNLSGCKEAKVCKKYTESKSNQVITVYDKAGNSKSSSTFNVTINTVKPVCSLKVSSDGTVSATLNVTAEYYGFNKDCTGSNELSKKIAISASKKDEVMAKSVSYYVKTKNGNVGSCHITVIKECKCTDPKNTSANCPVTCTFRAS